MKVIPVILSGGSGTRLWPLSRKDHPKQYLSLMGNHTMLQETILRLEGLDNLASPIIICNKDHRFIVAEQCKQINITNPTIILEPVGRNTAPAIAAAAFQSLMQSDNSILIILSTDHVIQDVEKFQKSIRLAIKQAKDGKLVTFGVVPKYAHTGFGYIKLSGETSRGVFNVESSLKSQICKLLSYTLNKVTSFGTVEYLHFKLKRLLMNLKFIHLRLLNQLKNL